MFRLCMDAVVLVLDWHCNTEQHVENAGQFRSDIFLGQDTQTYSPEDRVLSMTTVSPILI